MRQLPALALVAAVGTAQAEPTVRVRARAALDAAALAEQAGGTTATRVELDRAEVGGVARAGDHGLGVLTLEAIRSAGPTSAMGIDGNSLVLRLRHAAAGGTWRGAHELAVTGLLGLVPDPWIAALADHPDRARGRALVEDVDLVAASDLGVGVRIALGHAIAIDVVVGNGEGARDVERNRGKSTSVVARGEHTLAAIGTLALVAYGRDGSVGPGAARSHRLGAALAWHHARGAAAVEVVRAWGVAAQPDATAVAATAWVDVPVVLDLGASGRVDRLVIDAASGPARRWRASAAAWWAIAPSLRAELAVELERTDAGAASIPGVPDATDATRGELRVHGSFEGSP